MKIQIGKQNTSTSINSFRGTLDEQFFLILNPDNYENKSLVTRKGFQEFGVLHRR